MVHDALGIVREVALQETAVNVLKIASLALEAFLLIAAAACEGEVQLAIGKYLAPDERPTSRLHIDSLMERPAVPSSLRLRSRLGRIFWGAALVLAPFIGFLYGYLALPVLEIFVVGVVILATLAELIRRA